MYGRVLAVLWGASMNRRNQPDEPPTFNGNLTDRALVELLGSDGAEAGARSRAIEFIAIHICPQVEHVLKAGYGDNMHQDIEDALGGALGMLWERGSAGFCSDKGTFRSWFFRVVENRLIDIIRKNKKNSYENSNFINHKNVLKSLEFLEIDAGEPLPVIQALAAALSEVVGRDRAIIERFLLTDGDGAWAEGLARDLGVTSNVIRVAWLRLKGRLKVKILDELKSQMIVLPDAPHAFGGEVTP
jgi:DNA-directed RNA polymerase specialized sigma24 family protein